MASGEAKITVRNQAQADTVQRLFNEALASGRVDAIFTEPRENEEILLVISQDGNDWSHVIDVNGEQVTSAFWGGGMAGWFE